MTRREAAARAIHKSVCNTYDYVEWERQAPVDQAKFLCMADAAIEAADSFQAPAEADFVEDEDEPEQPDFYELQGLK